MTDEMVGGSVSHRAVPRSTLSAQSFLFGVFVSALVLLPLELPIAQGVHGVFRDVVGDYYPVFFIGSVLLCASALVVLARANHRCTDHNLFLYCFFSLLFVSIGIMALFVTALVGVELNVAIRQLLFGYVVPVAICLAMVSLDERQKFKAWLAFYIGWVLFLTGSLPFLIISYREAVAQLPGFAEGTFGQRLIMWRYTFAEPWNMYAQYIGNANKTSNNLVIFLLLSGVLLGSGRILLRGLPRTIFFSFWILGILTLFLLFSRAALLLLPVVVYFSGVLRAAGKGINWFVTLSALSFLVLGYSFYADAAIYLIKAEYMGTGEAGVLGTMIGRFDQWSEIWSFLMRKPEVLLFGMGAGGFGEAFYGDATAGTHNTFIDVLLESGVASLIVFLLLIFLMICIGTMNRANAQARMALVGTFVLVMLMMREHSFAYLYVTSLGGFSLVVLFYLLAARSRRSPRTNLAPTYRLPVSEQNRPPIFS